MGEKAFFSPVATCGSMVFPLLCQFCHLDSHDDSVLLQSKTNHSITDMLKSYYLQHRTELVNYAAKVLQGDRMAAEDVVQDTFLRLLTTQQLLTPVTLPALVYTALRNRLTDLHRHRQCRHRLETQYAIYAADRTVDDFTRYSACQMRTLVGQRISLMKETTACVMQLSILGECPVSEIAQQLGIDYKAVENRLQAGRKQLRPYVRRLLAV